MSGLPIVRDQLMLYPVQCETRIQNTSYIAVSYTHLIAASLGIALAYSLLDEQEAISSMIATNASPQLPFLIFLFLV